MTLITITCPHCGFSKEMKETRLPPDCTRATCPRCKGEFPLRRGRNEAAEAPPAFGLGTPPPSPPPPQPGEQAQASPPPLPAREQRAPRRTLTFDFTGTAGEYFGIWIVNTLLRVLTLGIYSPWAKVRKRRYFYCNTLLDNAPFDYLADPLAILKGWFIAGVFFGLYSLGSQISPLLGSVFMLIFAGVFPWVIVRSRIFNLRNSTLRNIRFSFRHDYQEAYLVFLGWPALSMLTLGILAPVALHRQKRFLVENSSYGTTRFSFDATPQDYYRVFIPLVVTVAVGGALVAVAAVSGKAAPGNLLPGLMAIPLLLLFFVFYYIVGVWVPTAITNITWNATRLGEFRFRSSLRARELAWIYASNAIAIPLSLGLLAPWATVRLTRYRLERLTLTGAGGLDTAAAADEQVDATGEELGDMLGFDFGL